MKLLYVFTGGRRSRLDAARAGQESPTEFLFGIPYLEARGHAVDLIELPDLQPDRTSPEYAALADENIQLQQVTGFTSTSHLFVGALGQLNSYDAIVAVGESVALGLVRFHRAGTLRTPVLSVCMKMLQRYPARIADDPWPAGLRDRAREVYGRIATPRYRERALWYRELLERSRRVLYFTRSELDLTRQTFPDLASRAGVAIQCMDTEFWRPAAVPVPADAPIVFMGNDRGRDLDLARRIATRLADRRFVFITNRLRPEDVSANVTLLLGDWKTSLISDADIREILRASALVMLPFKADGLDTLTSVAMQAMACGRPVVVSRTAGVWEPEFVDRENICFVAAPDADEWCRTIEALMTDTAARERIGANARAMVERDRTAAVLGATMEAFITG